MPTVLILVSRTMWRHSDDCSVSSRGLQSVREKNVTGIMEIPAVGLQNHSAMTTGSQLVRVPTLVNF